MVGLSEMRKPSFTSRRRTPRPNQGSTRHAAASISTTSLSRRAAAVAGSGADFSKLSKSGRERRALSYS